MERYSRHQIILPRNGSHDRSKRKTRKSRRKEKRVGGGCAVQEDGT
jgi:hypothetical protein